MISLLLIDYSPTELVVALQTERGVSLKVHPVSSLGPSWLGSSQPPRARMDQPTPQLELGR